MLNKQHNTDREKYLIELEEQIRQLKEELRRKELIIISLAEKLVKVD